MFKQIAKTVFYIVIISAIFVMLGFAVDSNSKSICKLFDIKVEYSEANYFVEPDDIREEVYAILGRIEGNMISEISASTIENIVNEMVFVENAHAYRTIDGEIRVKAHPRKPLIRIVNNFNQSYYLDDKGKLMPLSNKFTARVPVVFGNIKAKYSSILNLNSQKIDEVSNNDKILIEIYKIAKYINSDPFWNAFIDHLYITDTGEFELIPKNNIHTIEFGNLDNMEYKFDKMKIFYSNGLTRVGWRQYNKINVKYSNQIVCSK